MAVKNSPNLNKEQFPELHWREKCDPSIWILEEYKLLNNHYFHEDNQYWKTISIFGTLNAALLAFLSSDFVNNEAFVKHFVPIVGCLFSISWVISSIRTREWRNYMEFRIKVIEEYLHGVWDEKLFQPLDIRTLKDWQQQEAKIKWVQRPYSVIRNIPASLSLLTIPVCFLLTWIIIFFIQIK